MSVNGVSYRILYLWIYASCWKSHSLHINYAAYWCPFLFPFHTKNSCWTLTHSFDRHPSNNTLHPIYFYELNTLTTQSNETSSCTTIGKSKFQLLTILRIIRLRSGYVSLISNYSFSLISMCPIPAKILLLDIIKYNQYPQLVRYIADMKPYVSCPKSS